MQTEQKNRLKKLIFTLAVILIAGFSYYIFIRVTGWALPCVIYEITGKACPGCGTTRMFLALARLDFLKAAKSNLFLLIMLIPTMIFITRRAILYVKDGKAKYLLPEKLFIAFIVIAGIVFAILRNLPQFSFLYPI